MVCFTPAITLGKASLPLQLRGHVRGKGKLILLEIFGDEKGPNDK
jgi:hypothetical protein